MFCTNCGKEIAEGSAFCEFCGAKQETVGQTSEPVAKETESAETAEQGEGEISEQTETPETEQTVEPLLGQAVAPTEEEPAKKNYTKPAIGIAVGVIALAGVAVAVSSYNSDYSKFNRALNKGDYDTAGELYWAEGLSNGDDFDKMETKIESIIDSISDDYTNGKLTSDEALDELENYSVFWADNYFDTRYYIRYSEYYAEYLEDGDDKYADEDYLDAAYYYDLAIYYGTDYIDITAAETGLDNCKTQLFALIDKCISEGDYSTAYYDYAATMISRDYWEDDETLNEYVDKLKKSLSYSYSDDDTESETESETTAEEEETNAWDSWLETADSYYESEDYRGAYNEYSSILASYPSCTEAKEGMAKSLEGYRGYVYETAQSYLDNDDYTGAIDYLDSVINGSYLVEDEELINYQKKLTDEYVADVIEQANELADSNNWTKALTMIEDAWTLFPTNEKLAEAHDELSYAMPITLENVTCESSSSVDILTGGVKDNDGNVYDGAVRFNVNSKATATYNLAQKYTTFTGIMFDSTNYSNTSGTVSIYADETLIEYYEISQTDEPINLSIDVTDVYTLKIIVNRTSTYTPNIYFVNTSFEKASLDTETEELTEEDAETETEDVSESETKEETEEETETETEEAETDEDE